MEEKKRDSSYYCQMGNGNENLSTALFTAGIVLLLVCLKRALLLFLVEQWRAWVFLVLNIVVLAIFFTSMKKKDDEQEMEKKEGNCNEVEACKEELILKSEKITSNVAEDEEIKLEKDQKVVEENNIEAPKLSKEELNERVEAFISMFRQHLVMDGRKGRDKFYAERKQGDIRKHINLSSDGVNCFVLKVQG
ncbi:hypothetical protein PTKIN_Ptkin07bG0042000 [Pterospermum kingtungense]